MSKKAVVKSIDNSITLEPGTMARKHRVVWDEREVAKRALELFDLESAAESAHRHALDRCDDFKEARGLERVNHDDPNFRRYTAKAWGTYVEARREVKKARTRLQTACRNCKRDCVPRLKVPEQKMSKRTVARLFGE